MKAIRSPILRSAALAVALAALGAGGVTAQASSTGETAADYAAQTSAGRVSLEVLPRWESGRLVFTLQANTHSVDLSGVDLRAAMRLRLGDRVLEPVQAGSMQGHHARAEVAFALDAPPQAFRLEIRGVPDVPVRTLAWPAERSSR